MNDSDSVRRALALVSDRDLLANIRRRSVSLADGAMFGTSYWERDSSLRREAKRRNLL